MKPVQWMNLYDETSHWNIVTTRPHSWTLQSPVEVCKQVTQIICGECVRKSLYGVHVLIPLSLLPISAQSVLPLPVKLDPQLQACSKWTQYYTYQRRQIHCYRLAPSDVRLLKRWELACQSCEAKHVRALKVSLSQLGEPEYQIWKL